MAEPSMILFSFQEVAELMIKQQGIHDGIWGIYIKFGIGAANASDAAGDLFPTALVPVKEIGLQKFDTPSNLTVDAAKVNPAPKEKTTRKTSSSKKTLTKK